MIKYELYLDTISKIESESKLLLAMNFRINNCLNKILFCLVYLEENFSNHESIINFTNELVNNALDNDEKNKMFSNKEKIKNINSFIGFSKITKS